MADRLRFSVSVVVIVSAFLWFAGDHKETYTHHPLPRIPLPSDSQTSGRDEAVSLKKDAYAKYSTVAHQYRCIDTLYAAGGRAITLK